MVNLFLFLNIFVFLVYFDCKAGNDAASLDFSFSLLFGSELLNFEAVKNIVGHKFQILNLLRWQFHCFSVRMRSGMVQRLAWLARPAWVAWLAQ